MTESSLSILRTVRIAIFTIDFDVSESDVDVIHFKLMSLVANVCTEALTVIDHRHILENHSLRRRVRKCTLIIALVCFEV